MSGRIRVSMFNVGFGDCFLVEVPVGRKPFRILFDCGRHKGGMPANQMVADQVIAAARDRDGVSRIDVVVATHRHKDHVSGFAADGWEKVEVREVWMPWTEDPTDPKARGLVERQVAAATAAIAAFGPAAATDRMAHLLGLALSNEAAMDTLYHGFAGSPKRRYLPDREAPTEPVTLAGAPGLRFHILGPTRDEAGLGIMDPPKAETFRKLAAAAAHERRREKLAPFAAQWRCAADGVDALLTKKERASIASLSTLGNLTALSAALDKAINNTSLVVMIEAGDEFLLFCADAQWGSWQAILAEARWRELLGKTTFLKVGHHASHNASPVTLINALLPEGIPAMISVDPTAYPSVPYGKLVDAFALRKFEVARSDEPADVPAAFKVEGDVIALEMDL